MRNEDLHEKGNFPSSLFYLPEGWCIAKLFEQDPFVLPLTANIINEPMLTKSVIHLLINSFVLKNRIIRKKYTSILIIKTCKGQTKNQLAEQ